MLEQIYTSKQRFIQKILTQNIGKKNPPLFPEHSGSDKLEIKLKRKPSDAPEGTLHLKGRVFFGNFS